MIKRAIKKAQGRTFITMAGLQTLVLEIDRPLAYVSNDIIDEEPLTPSHLLYGTRITSLTYPVVEEDELPSVHDN